LKHVLAKSSAEYLMMFLSFALNCLSLLSAMKNLSVGGSSLRKDEPLIKVLIVGVAFLAA